VAKKAKKKKKLLLSCPKEAATRKIVISVGNTCEECPKGQLVRGSLDSDVYYQCSVFGERGAAHDECLVAQHEYDDLVAKI